MLSQNDTRTFEQVRPNLIGLAYRILGSLSDAEDAVQDTYLKWEKADRNEINDAGPWLTTICTRRCLDILRAAHRSRVSYVGAWLPEPIHTPIENEAERNMELASSLTTAFMLMLDRLSPKERAAYLLYDIFDIPYSDVAKTLDMREDACRKLVSRAKGHIEQAKVRHTTSLKQQNQLLAAFQHAVTSGATDQLANLLSEDIRFHADHGGKVEAVQNILDGIPEVTAFICEGLHGFWQGYEWVSTDINGARGFVLRTKTETAATVSFAYDEAGQVIDIYVMRNPDKLTHLDAIAIH
jgi:RNA polymerase sigma factor (sigma-70 family)